MDAITNYQEVATKLEESIQLATGSTNTLQSAKVGRLLYSINKNLYFGP